MSQQHFSSSLQVPEPEYAGFWWRLFALFLDTLVGVAFGCLFGAVVFAVVFGVSLISGNNSTVVKALAGIFQVLNSLLCLIGGWLYHACLESSAWQATLGKKMCGLRVTNLSGERLTFARASVRYFGQYISALACFVGYFMVAFTEKKQALHDIIAGTVVVKAN